MSINVISDIDVKLVSGGCKCMCTITMKGKTSVHETRDFPNEAECRKHCAFIRACTPYPVDFYECKNGFFTILSGETYNNDLQLSC